MTLQVISSAQLTDTNSAAVEASGVTHITMQGTWGGASAKIAMSPDNGTTYIDIPGATLSANGTFIVDLANGSLIRVTTSGGSGAAITTRAGNIP